VLTSLVAGLGAFTGCTSSGGNGGTGIFSGTGGTGIAGSTSTTAGTGGTSAGTAGSGGTSTGSGGTTSAGTGGAAGTGTGGAAGTGTGTGGTGTGGTAGTGAGGTAGTGTGGAAGMAVSSDITKVVAAGTGCGKAPPAAFTPGTLAGPQHIMTMGTMAPNCADAATPPRPPNGATKCGAWQDTRDYWVKLPTGYDNTKPYPLVFEGPGCGGHGNNLYTIPGFDSTVIRVGVSPSAYWQQYHATNPGQGCFDDKNDDSSVDWPFYEALYDQLASEICFDRNRVFAGGNSSGAWFSNELGCKYAGDAKRPVRGIMPNTGGLPTDPSYVPTCTTAGMAGFWSHDPGDTTNPFSGNIVAMDRALTVDGYTPAGVTYDSANTAGAFDPFPIGTGPNDCRKYKNGPALYPMVICLLPGTGHASHDNVVDPGWPAFINLFMTAPLLTM
jgi:poly(3-hydroxybutyrate) depolymerase